MAQIKYYIESTWCEGQAAPYVGEEIFLLDTARANVLAKAVATRSSRTEAFCGSAPHGLTRFPLVEKLVAFW
jgi:hypothetical protein